MTTENDNRVTLNGVSYAIREGVRAQPANEFQAGLRQGSPQYDNREGALILTLEDPSGGLGVLDADERKNQHMRVRYSDGADTRFPKTYTLGGLVTQATLAGVAFPSGIPQAKIRQWKDELVIAVGTKVFKLDSALAVTDITPTNKVAEVGANAETSDLLVHDFNDGLFANNPAILWGLKNATGSDYYIAAATTLVAASWSAQDNTVAEELNSMVSFDQKVLKIQGAFMKESNEGTINTWGDLALPTVTDGSFMTVPKFSFFIGTHRVPFGPDFMPWLILAGDGGYVGEVAMLDYWARQLKPLELNIGRVADGYMLDDGVVVSNGYDVWKIVPSDPPSLQVLGIRRQEDGQGLDPQFADAVVSGLGSISGELVVGLTNLKGGGNGRIWILHHNGAGFHVRAEQSVDTGIVLAIGQYEKPASLYGFRSASYLVWVTWDGTTCKLNYIQEPIGNGNPEQDPTYKYAASGAFETPWMYGGQEDLFGAALRMRIRGKRLTANETITVKYRLDDDDSGGWTTLGTFNNATTVLSFGANGVGVQFRSIRWRFEFARGGTNTNAPVARAFIFAYLKKPLTRMAYNFIVDASRLVKEGEFADFKAVYTSLMTAKESYVLVPFSYDNEPTRYVQVQSLPTSEQDLHDSLRSGAITVQVVEPIDD